jgi:glycosyltransferase involved in cell wall biosynthesis
LQFVVRKNEEKSMAKALISVIVPVYKVETELGKCVKSVINQTYKNLEIILVDDGSPDNCPEICDNFSKEDSRIKVLHKENGGLSDARNAGLDIANGDYISFVDSDDWIEPDFIEVLLTNIETNDADISICNYRMVNEQGQIRHYIPENSSVELFDHDQGIRELFANIKFTAMMPTKLYKKHLFDDIRFPKDHIYEDVAVSGPLFDKCNKTILCNRELYNYFQRTNSIVNSKFNHKQLDILLYAKQRIEYAISNDNKFIIEAESFYLKCLLNTLLNAFEDKSNSETRTIIGDLKKDLKKHKKYILNNKYIENRRKVLMVAILLGLPSSVMVKQRNKRIKESYE